MHTFSTFTSEICHRLNVEAEIKICSSGQEVLAEIEQDFWDAVILAVDIPGMSGFQTAEAINELPDHPEIIFVSGEDHLVYDSFAYRPFWFLKRSDLDRISEALQKLIKHIQMQERAYIFKSGGRKMSILLSDIIYFENRNHDLTLYAKDGMWKYRESIERVESHLAEYHFIRCHVGFLVNCRYVTVVEKGGLILRGGQMIPISRKRQKETEMKFMKYMRNAKL